MSFERKLQRRNREKVPYCCGHRMQKKYANGSWTWVCQHCGKLKYTKEV